MTFIYLFSISQSLPPPFPLSLSLSIFSLSLGLQCGQQGFKPSMCPLLSLRLCSPINWYRLLCMWQMVTPLQSECNMLVSFGLVDSRHIPLSSNLARFPRTLVAQQSLALFSGTRCHLRSCTPQCLLGFGFSYRVPSPCYCFIVFVCIVYVFFCFVYMYILPFIGSVRIDSNSSEIA